MIIIISWSAPRSRQRFIVSLKDILHDGCWRAWNWAAALKDSLDFDLSYLTWIGPEKPRWGEIKAQTGCDKSLMQFSGTWCYSIIWRVILQIHLPLVFAYNCKQCTMAVYCVAAVLLYIQYQYNVTALHMLWTYGGYSKQSSTALCWQQ